jgi:hypothetical protein
MWPRLNSNPLRSALTLSALTLSALTLSALA